MLRCRRTRAGLASVALACLFAAACADAPTEANSFVHEAGGSVWVAVAPPAGLPDTRAWTPFLAKGSEAERAVRHLAEEAKRARRAGELERAASLETQAARAAAGGVAQAPPPVRLLSAVAALDSWLGRAEERLQSGSFPELERAAERVREMRNAARASMTQGDSLRAVVQLTEAAEAAREFAPMAVALRLVSRSEARIDAEAEPSQNLRRARLLLRTAREAMATGDETRAMKRAWYALQLIEAEEAAAAGR